MQVKFYSPLTADFFPNEPDYEDEFYDEYEGYPQDGHELLEYETAIRDAVENDTRDFGGDLMQYYHEDDSVRNKVVTAVPSVEVHGNKLCGCLTVELKETLLDDEQTVLCNYITGQYSDGWGEGFEQREIQTADGVLYVYFWEAEPFSFEVVPVQIAEPAKAPPVPKRPKMKLAGMDGNIFSILGRAARLLRENGQPEQAKEMADRVYQSGDYRQALSIISEYVETELSVKPPARSRKERGDAR